MRKFVITEQCATGQIYTRRASKEELLFWEPSSNPKIRLGSPRPKSDHPGTAAAIGCWSYATPVIHAKADGSCCRDIDDNPFWDGEDPTFVCSKCKRVVGFCMGCDSHLDDDLCDDCWVPR